MFLWKARITKALFFLAIAVFALRGWAVDEFSMTLHRIGKEDGFRNHFFPATVYALLVEGCHQYAPFTHLPCEVSSYFGTRELDLRINGTFERELKNLISDKKYLLSFFEALIQQLDLTIQTGKSTNLWEWTVAFTNGDQEEALKLIAVIFQDLSGPLSPYLGYDQEIYKLYCQAENRLMTLRFRMSRDQKNHLLELYPSSIRGTSKTLYHFYTMAYLSRKLVKEKHLSSGEAFLIPMELGLIYEDVKHLLGSKTGKNLSQYDLYLDYTGAIWGITLKYNGLSETQFITQISEFGAKGFLSKELIRIRDSN